MLSEPFRILYKQLKRDYACADVDTIVSPLLSWFIITVDASFVQREFLQHGKILRKSFLYNTTLVTY